MYTVLRTRQSVWAVMCNDALTHVTVTLRKPALTQKRLHITSRDLFIICRGPCQYKWYVFYV